MFIKEFKQLHLEVISHSVKVAILAEIIATQIGYDEDRCREIVISSLLHDIGKANIPLEILFYPGSLNAKQWDIMKSHTTEGFQTLKQYKGMKKFALIARDHHERLDGSGYPNGSRGHEICEETRIVMIADMFEGIYAKRPYHEKRTIEDTKKILMKNIINGEIDSYMVDSLYKGIDEVTRESINLDLLLNSESNRINKLVEEYILRK